MSITAKIEQPRMKVLPLDAFRCQLRAQGVPPEHFAFNCPMCGTTQSASTLIRAGAGADFNAVEKYLGFSCVGRWTGGPSPSEAKKNSTACNWTLGGLFQCHTLEIELPESQRVPRFELATPEEAKALMAGFQSEQSQNEGGV